MKLGKKILVASALLTLFANSFADMHYHVTLAYGNTAFTTEASALKPGQTQLNFTPGQTTDVTIPGAAQTPLIMTFNGEKNVMVVPNGITSQVLPTGIPLNNLIHVTMADSNDVDVQIDYPQFNVGTRANLQFFMAPGETAIYSSTSISGDAGGQNGVKFIGRPAIVNVTVQGTKYDIFIDQNMSIPFIQGLSILAPNTASNTTNYYQIYFPAGLSAQ